MLHGLLRYVGLGHPATGEAAQTILDTAFAAARASNPQLWALPSHHIPTRQAKFEEFCLHLAPRMPESPKERRALIEAAITRLEIGLREANVGDLGVAKEMRTLAAALNGRLQAYEAALKTHDFHDFNKKAQAHGVAPATIQAAWPFPSEKKPKETKKPLPKPAKPAKARSISGN